MPKGKPLFLSILCLLCLSSIALFSTVKSQVSSSSININVDGSVEPSTAPIQIVGNIYVFTDNISSSILVHRSNIVIDGDGHTLFGNGGTGIDLTNNTTQIPSPLSIWNVTIKNLAVIGFHIGINTNGGGNITLYNDYIVTGMKDNAAAVSLWGCGGNNISYCNLIGQTVVAMQFGSSHNTITKNNIDGSVWVEIGGDETVDGNYWSDYLTVYPNATEIGETGIGNTPYVYYSYSNSQSGLFETPLYDYHPQISPITTPLFFSSMVRNLASSIPELSWLVIIPLMLSTPFVAVLLRHRKTA